MGDRSGAALGENTSTTLDHLLYESGYNRWEKILLLISNTHIFQLEISLFCAVKIPD